MVEIDYMISELITLVSLMMATIYSSQLWFLLAFCILIMNVYYNKLAIKLSKKYGIPKKMGQQLIHSYSDKPDDWIDEKLQIILDNCRNHEHLSSLDRERLFLEKIKSHLLMS